MSMSKLITSTWASFVTSGDPTPPGSEISWSQVHEKDNDKEKRQSHLEGTQHPQAVKSIGVRFFVLKRSDKETDKQAGKKSSKQTNKQHQEAKLAGVRFCFTSSHFYIFSQQLNSCFMTTFQDPNRIQDS